MNYAFLKDAEGSGYGQFNVGYYIGIFLEELRKITETWHDRWSPVQSPNLNLPNMSSGIYLVIYFYAFLLMRVSNK
jgi:hypothetical protein